MTDCGADGYVDCATVLEQLFSYLDSEETTIDGRVIEEHLKYCGPCMTEHDREKALKLLLRRSCACESAPETLRVRIQESLQIRIVRS